MILTVLWWFLSLFFSGFTLEIVVYIILENYTKQALSKARNYAEKKALWFEECAVIAFVGLVIYFHHFPYFLFTMFSATIVLVNLPKKTNSRNSRLDDSKEEDLSPKLLNFYRHPNDENYPPPNVAVITDGVSNRFVVDRNDSRKTHYPLQNNVPLRLNQSYSSYYQNENNNVSRKSLAITETFAERFRPRGLNNDDENLCFFNSILQVLARTDGLLHELMRATVEERKEGRLLDEFVRILGSLTNPEPSFAKPTPINTSDLRRLLIQAYKKTLSPEELENRQDKNNVGILMQIGRWLGWNKNDGRRGCILKLPSSGLQDEEDVAEIFMWIMEILENELSNSNIRLYTDGHFYRQIQNWWKIHGRCGPNTIKKMILYYTDQFKDYSERPGLIETLTQLDWLSRFVPILEAESFGLFNLKHLFTGQISTTSKCNRCKKKTIFVDVFKLLPVPLRNESTVDIEKLLERITSQEMSTICHSCSQSFKPLHSSSPKPSTSKNQNIDMVLSPIARTPTPQQNITRHVTIINLLPPYFVVQLLRFNVEKPAHSLFTQSPSKITTKVRMSSQPINLHSILRVTSPQQELYHLYAIILHSSSSSIGSSSTCETGHYSSVVKVSGDKWCLFNDDKVIHINDINQYLDTPDIQENVYLLFYCKLNRSPGM